MWNVEYEAEKPRNIKNKLTNLFQSMYKHALEWNMQIIRYLVKLIRIEFKYVLKTVFWTRIICFLPLLDFIKEKPAGKLSVNLSSQQITQASKHPPLLILVFP